MGNEEFLVRLEALLQGQMPDQEIRNVIDYHREYFAEAGENAAAELDTPETIAQRVLAEYYNPPAKREGTWLRALLVAASVVACIIAATAVLWGVNSARWSGRPWGWDPVLENYVTIGVGEPVGVAEEADAVTFSSEASGIDREKMSEGGMDPFHRLIILGDVPAGRLIVRSGLDYSVAIDYDGYYEEWKIHYAEDETLLLLGELLDEDVDHGGARITVTVPWNEDTVLQLGVDEVKWETTIENDVAAEFTK